MWEAAAVLEATGMAWWTKEPAAEMAEMAVAVALACRRRPEEPSKTQAASRVGREAPGGSQVFSTVRPSPLMALSAPAA